jgi:hypothetical protein
MDAMPFGERLRLIRGPVHRAPAAVPSSPPQGRLRVKPPAR